MSLMTMIEKMFEGLGGTCAIFFLTLIFALPLGMGVAMGVLANALASVLGVRIRQHQQKRRSKFYILPRAKTSRFPEKSSEKRLKMPWVKVQVH